MALPAELSHLDALVDVLVDALVREFEAGESESTVAGPGKEKAGHVGSVAPALRISNDGKHSSRAHGIKGR
jgi:hypothetical protein